MSQTQSAPADPDRRGVLASTVGAATAAALAGWSASAPSTSGPAPTPAGAHSRLRASARREFRGRRQAGIIDPPQSYAAFVGLDLSTPIGRDRISRTLTVLTDDIERLMSGRGGLADQEPELAATTAELTVTVGVGPRLVEALGRAVPVWLGPLPPFRIDQLEDRWTGTDLLLQICAHSPTTVAHAQRRLLTSVEPLAAVRWVQRGFREPFEGPQRPMRNLMGQVDGTVQPALDGPDDGLLFIGNEGPAWLQSGSALVLRRIRMDLTTWDRVDRLSRENAIGRRLDTGAPVSAPAGASPHTPADLVATDDLGFHVIDDGAHLRRAQPHEPHERFLRRPYSYDEEPSPDAPDSGLIFAAYMADPLRQFVPVQRRLAEKDLLNLWTTPIGSAVYAVLPGALAGEVLGQALLT